MRVWNGAVLLFEQDSSPPSNPPVSLTHFLRKGACAGMPGCQDNPFRKKLKVYFFGGENQIARFDRFLYVWRHIFSGNEQIVRFDHFWMFKWTFSRKSQHFRSRWKKVQVNHGSKNHRYYRVILNHQKWVTMVHLVHLNQKNLCSLEPKKPMFTWIFSKNSHHFRRQKYGSNEPWFQKPSIL